MRIIAGELKGRILAPVKGRMRPTAAKVREAVFSILGETVAGARVLDLFAGTGALGIEALSRGAREAVFVDESPVALRVLRRNLETLGLEGRSRVLPMPALTALKKLAAAGERFDLVFMDPPYGGGVAATALGALAAAEITGRGAGVVVEHSRRENLAASYGGLTLQQVRTYGDSRVAFYLAAPGPEEKE